MDVYEDAKVAGSQNCKAAVSHLEKRATRGGS